MYIFGSCEPSKIHGSLSAFQASLPWILPYFWTFKFGVLQGSANQLESPGQQKSLASGSVFSLNPWLHKHCLYIDLLILMLIFKLLLLCVLVTLSSCDRNWSQYIITLIHSQIKYNTKSENQL